MEEDYYIPVQDTNDSSTVSKASISLKGYFVDPFIEKFVSRKVYRSPLINRGYYIRCKAINHVISTFLQHTTAESKRQILSLGAGYDTSFFRLRNEELLKEVKYFEVDYPRVVYSKIQRIRNCSLLESCLDGWCLTKGCLNSEKYSVIGCDLTDLKLLQVLLINNGLDFTLPTLIISECVLTYISPVHVDAIVQWCSSRFNVSIICTYEQIYPNDGFGLVMYGWKLCQSCNMYDFYNSLPVSEKNRIESIETFDEYEEFELKCAHYNLLCATSSRLAEILQHILPIPTKLEVPPFSNDSIVYLKPLKTTKGSISVSRYAHSSVMVSDNAIVCIGGFGVDSYNHHRRLDDILLISMESDKCNVKRIEALGYGPGPIVHHKTVIYNNSVLVVGGRNSPYQPNSKYYTLNISEAGGEWRLNQPHELSDRMEPRWRHSVTTVKLCGKRIIVVVGGISTSNQPLKNSYILYTDSSKLRLERLPVVLPEGRHSHGAVEIENGLVICGGLTTHMRHLNNAIVIRDVQGQWSMSVVNLYPYINCRYSMASCVNSFAFLCGGIFMNLPGYLMEIDVTTTATKTYLIQEENGTKFIPSGHTLHKINDNLIIIGGGGNCFSFGTHFNTMQILKV